MFIFSHSLSIWCLSYTKSLEFKSVGISAPSYSSSSGTTAVYSSLVMSVFFLSSFFYRAPKYSCLSGLMRSESLTRLEAARGTTTSTMEHSSTTSSALIFKKGSTISLRLSSLKEGGLLKLISSNCSSCLFDICWRAVSVCSELVSWSGVILRSFGRPALTGGTIFFPDFSTLASIT